MNRSVGDAVTALEATWILLAAPAHIIIEA